MSTHPPPPVWWNGQLLPEAEALVPTQSQGWLWGRGVFETIAVRDGQALALTRHLARLQQSAPRLGLLPPDEPALRDAIAAVLAGCPPGPHRLRLTLTGAEAPGLDLSPTPGHLLIRCQALPANFSAEPAILLTVPWRRNEFSPLAGVKSTSYAENAIALAHVRERDATEALFLNTAGDLCEGAVSNLFLIKDGVVLTPSLNCGCLPGITRGLVLELCQQLNVPCQQKFLSPADLAAADSAFLTNSLHGILPVASADARPLDAPCPLTARLSAALTDLLQRLPDP